MSIHTTFPDAIVFPDGTIRLVTRAAKNLVYSNTDIGRIFSLSTADAVPDYLQFDDTIAEMFADEGMTVKRERMPVGHYRSKRRRWPKSTTPASNRKTCGATSANSTAGAPSGRRGLAAVLFLPRRFCMSTIHLDIV